MNGAQSNLLEDGRRLHLHHGPIDLIIEVEGHGRALAFEIASSRFATVLEELVRELPQLRQACRAGHEFKGDVAQRMQQAAQNFLPGFVTPMAAVAGSVADEILEAMKNAGDFEKIHVNNGGDIAFHITGNKVIKAAIASGIPAMLQIHATDNYRGIATSGWGGRSHSLGIADSVTVVAKNAAIADCAATMIANAINLPDHPAIKREPATSIFPDSDLGDRLVTTGVGVLNSEEISQALSDGEALANKYARNGLIGGALLTLKNEFRQIGPLEMPNLCQTQVGELQYA